MLPPDGDSFQLTCWVRPILGDHRVAGKKSGGSRQPDGRLKFYVAYPPTPDQDAIGRRPAVRLRPVDGIRPIQSRKNNFGRKVSRRLFVASAQEASSSVACCLVQAATAGASGDVNI
jgi:hypothetical protein